MDEISKYFQSFKQLQKYQFQFSSKNCETDCYEKCTTFPVNPYPKDGTPVPALGQIKLIPEAKAYQGGTELEFNKICYTVCVDNCKKLPELPKTNEVDGIFGIAVILAVLIFINRKKSWK